MINIFAFDMLKSTRGSKNHTEPQQDNVVMRIKPTSPGPGEGPGFYMVFLMTLTALQTRQLTTHSFFVSFR
jgi:hypothetical protein